MNEHATLISARFPDIDLNSDVVVPKPIKFKSIKKALGLSRFYKASSKRSGTDFESTAENSNGNLNKQMHKSQALTSNNSNEYSHVLSQEEINGHKILNYLYKNSNKGMTLPELMKVNRLTSSTVSVCLIFIRYSLFNDLLQQY